MEKEIKLIEQWQPLHTSDVRVETPRVFADRNGILIAWVLPSIVPLALQVSLSGYLQTYHTILALLDSTLHWDTKIGRNHGI